MLLESFAHERYCFVIHEAGYGILNHSFVISQLGTNVEEV